MLSKVTVSNDSSSSRSFSVTSGCSLLFSSCLSLKSSMYPSIVVAMKYNAMRESSVQRMDDAVIR